MKRDCGAGELVITTWVVKKVDQFDKIRTITQSTTRADAERVFDTTATALLPFEDVMLYVGDKQGYMNCVASCQYGQPADKRRLSEID